MKNEGTADRVLRVLLGIVALVLAFTTLGVLDGAILGVVVAIVGAVLLLTGVVGFCPAYKVCGMRTCKVDLSTGD